MSAPTISVENRKLRAQMRVYALEWRLHREKQCLCWAFQSREECAKDEDMYFRAARDTRDVSQGKVVAPEPEGVPL